MSIQSLQRTVSNEQIRAAFDILASVYPLLAAVLWLRVVEEKTEQEVARTLGKNEGHLRKLLNGYNRAGRSVWGARRWLQEMLTLLEKARKCPDGDELDPTLAFSRGKNPWGEPFPGAMLDILLQAMDRDALCCLLDHIHRARLDERRDRMIFRLLDGYERSRLPTILDELCASQRRPPAGRAQPGVMQ